MKKSFSSSCLFLALTLTKGVVRLLKILWLIISCQIKIHQREFDLVRLPCLCTPNRLNHILWPQGTFSQNSRGKDRSRRQQSGFQDAALLLFLVSMNSLTEWIPEAILSARIWRELYGVHVKTCHYRGEGQIVSNDRIFNDNLVNLGESK